MTLVVGFPEEEDDWVDGTRAAAGVMLALAICVVIWGILALAGYGAYRLVAG